VLLFIGLFVQLNGFNQIVTTDPEYPTQDTSCIVYFDATGTDLEGYNGDVYTHTGVSIDGSQWQYVIGSWGNNSTQPQLTNIGIDLYQLDVTPSIRDFYAVQASENITEMCFVFRSSDGGTQTHPDIFIDVYGSELIVIIQKPELPGFLTELNEPIEVLATSPLADSMFLYVNDVEIKAIADIVLNDTILADNFGSYWTEQWVKVMAKNETDMVVDSFSYIVIPESPVAELPEGIMDGINYIDENTVILSLFAPYKEFVFAIGDFSNWEVDSSNYMLMTPDSNRFWLQINDLIPEKEYIFQYFIDGEIKIGDPYADKTSDPWNDKYITNSTYPNLIEYPYGKTTGIATVFQTAQQAYEWETQNFEPPEITDLVIYEMLIRDFTTEHTYQSLIDTLGYLERLGVNAIELMPVNEFEGNISWGYNPSFYFAPDKYYGPKNDLKHFIDVCHSKGIAVLIDLVLNHSYDQSPFVQMYFDGDNPTEENPWYNVHSNFTNPDAHWGNDFNHESPETQQLVDSINHYWMSEYKVDGFRFDFTKGFGNNIKGPNDPWGSLYDADRIVLLKRMADEIWNVNPDAYVIFEHLAENSEEKELADYGILLWGNLHYNYGEASMGWNENGKSDFSWISYQERNWNEPHVIGYMESHDEERVMFKNLSWGNSNANYNIKDS
ncbi:MAG: Por secretion system protein, partial [Bacteroidales bacterium]|nr:Por secretion system protein [Bacteroidales bacterium]